jgi:uracil-DNA glycosylase
MSRRLEMLDRHELGWLRCERCRLHETRSGGVVQWRGSESAAIFVIGEAPGEEEDKQGLPFVGRSGQLLDRALIEAGLDPKESVFIANRIGCRPPSNRQPELDELRECGRRLEQMITIVRPKVLLLVGSTAARLVGVREVLRWRGQEQQYELGRLKIPAIVTTHPSYVLRKGGQSSEEFRLMVKDVETAKRYC